MIVTGELHGKVAGKAVGALNIRTPQPEINERAGDDRSACFTAWRDTFQRSPWPPPRSIGRP
jgi:hypothetical protein